MSFKIRSLAALGVVIAALVALAVTLAGSASAVSTPPGGDTISCSASGTTPVWSQNNVVTTSACLSFETGFYASQPNAPTSCYAAGYVAQVWTTSYVKRFDATWCRDGLWHFSSAWSSNEARFSQMQINGGGVYWYMAQYRR